MANEMKYYNFVISVAKSPNHETTRSLGNYAISLNRATILGIEDESEYPSTLQRMLLPGVQLDCRPGTRANFQTHPARRPVGFSFS
jgi:hypothetical protein